MAEDQDVQHLMNWYKDFGIKSTLSLDPQNLFALSRKTVQAPSPSSLKTELSSPVLNRSIPLGISSKEAVGSARLLADQAQTLDDLRTAMMLFEGCALKITATNLVFGDGNPQSSVMLVGEAPGADEDRQGLPFVGLSGQLLNKMLATVGLKRTENFYISNVIPWRPPGNRQPSPQEVAACLPFIQKHIALINPKVLVCVGGTAVKALLDRAEGIMKLRGRSFDYTNPYLSAPVQTLAIYHPAYLHRSPNQKRQAWHDLLRLKKLIA